ncbi:MAG: multicopper oxidase family protein [Rhodospirillales bacterium]|nr:multicopper oxidase family protein [Rhodospirillales bacterium]
MKLSRRALLGAAAMLPAATVCAEPARALTARTLTAGTRTLDVLGKPTTVFSLVGDEGKPGLAFAPGEPFAVTFRNELSESTLLHWHGLTPPPAQDGTPGLSAAAILAGGSAEYRFPLLRPATAWAHPLGLQQQRLLAAPIIVHAPADAALHEQIMQLADFAFADAGELQAALGGAEGDGEAIAYDAFLANGRSLDDPEIRPVAAGETLRVRIINAASATGFTIETGALEAHLVAVDGNPIVPLAASSFPLALGQRLDLLVRVPDAGAYPIIAAAEGRTDRAGLVLATRGARVARLARQAPQQAGLLDAGFEKRLAADHRLPAMRPDRRLSIRLDGQARPYAWTITGDDLRVHAGERVELAITNATDRAQPVHLHGHVFEVVGIGDGRMAGALRDTVSVAAGATVTVAFDADNPGAWLLHSTHLYRLLAGMAAILSYGA